MFSFWRFAAAFKLLLAAGSATRAILTDVFADTGFFAFFAFTALSPSVRSLYFPIDESRLKKWGLLFIFDERVTRGSPGGFTVGARDAKGRLTHGLTNGNKVNGSAFPIAISNRPPRRADEGLGALFQHAE